MLNKGTSIQNNTVQYVLYAPNDPTRKPQIHNIYVQHPYRLVYIFTFLFLDICLRKCSFL